jgi:hypothetical protein
VELRTDCRIINPAPCSEVRVARSERAQYYRQVSSFRASAHLSAALYRRVARACSRTFLRFAMGFILNELDRADGGIQNSVNVQNESLGADHCK